MDLCVQKPMVISSSINLLFLKCYLPIQNIFLTFFEMPFFFLNVDVCRLISFWTMKAKKIVTWQNFLTLFVNWTFKVHNSIYYFNFFREIKNIWLLKKNYTFNFQCNLKTNNLNLFEKNWDPDHFGIKETFM